MTVNDRNRSVPSHGGGTRRHPRAWTAIIGAAVLTGLSGLLAAAPATAGPAADGDLNAVMAPAANSAALADVTAQQYFSYRAAFAPNQALSIGFLTPQSMTPYSNSSGGPQDWHKEGSTNGFRLHNRLYQVVGLGDWCLAGSGAQVLIEECAPNSNKFSQNWKLVKTGGIARLQHSNGLYVTYPPSASGDVFLASQGTAITQSFLENNEGIK